jgi:hypothetical protein
MVGLADSVPGLADNCIFVGRFLLSAIIAVLKVDESQ